MYDHSKDIGTSTGCASVRASCAKHWHRVMWPHSKSQDCDPKNLL